MRKEQNIHNYFHSKTKQTSIRERILAGRKDVLKAAADYNLERKTQVNNVKK